MTTQVAVRLDDELLESLDWLVVRCDDENRVEVIRAASAELDRRERSREIGEPVIEGIGAMCAATATQPAVTWLTISSNVASA